MLFDDLYGQTEIKKILTDMIANDRVGHAFVFCGPDGIGRKSFAKAFAAALMCNHRADEEASPCGTCVGCTLMRNGTNPDYIVIEEEHGKSTLGVETVRGMQEDLAKAPEYGRRKVYVIDCAERLTAQAQNALLKTIEDPPEYAVVILICSNISMLIDTVRSRVVRLDFARNSDREVLRVFREHSCESRQGGEDNPSTDEELICAYADGIIGRALEIQNFDQFRQLRERLAEILRLLCQGKTSFLLDFSELFDKNQAHKEFLFFSLNSFFRDVMMMSRFANQTELQNVQFRDTIKKLADSVGYHKSAACIAIIGEAWAMLGRNVNYKLTVDSTAIRLQEAVR